LQEQGGPPPAAPGRGGAMDDHDMMQQQPPTEPHGDPQAGMGEAAPDTQYGEPQYGTEAPPPAMPAPAAPLGGIPAGADYKPSGRAAVASQGGGDQNAFITMEEILERLKLLNYEQVFFPKGFRALTRTFFAMPSSNPAEQFHYFTTLATWLMNKLGNDAKPPSHYDDPNSTVAHLTLELKKIGVANDFPPIKVKQGHGDAVCAILLSLLERIGHEFNKPYHHPDDYAEEAQVDDEAALDADNIADEVGVETEDEDDMYYGGGGITVDEDRHKQAVTTIEPSIEPEEWRLELERVLPQLKVTVVSDGKEWRTHIAQAKQQQDAVLSRLPQSTATLEKIEKEVSETLDMVSKIEKKLNSQCEQDIAEYAAKQEDFTAKQEDYNKNSEGINKLQNELATVTEELQGIKGRMDERGSAMTDTSPVVKIKTALSKIKQEARSMEVRIGVVSHTLVLKRLSSNGLGGHVPTSIPLKAGVD